MSSDLYSSTRQHAEHHCCVVHHCCVGGACAVDVGNGAVVIWWIVNLPICSFASCLFLVIWCFVAGEQLVLCA